MQIYGNLPYKCSIQKKRQIQLFVRDIMNSICPTNFFRTTDTTDTTDNTIWKPGFNLNCLVFPPRHLYLIQNVLWKVKRFRRNQNWIDMGENNWQRWFNEWRHKSLLRRLCLFCCAACSEVVNSDLIGYHCEKESSVFYCDWCFEMFPIDWCNQTSV